MTLDEKIAVVDRLIDEFRWSRPMPETEEYRTYATLKEIAEDLRGRLAGTPGIVEHELETRIASARASKTGMGYPQTVMVALAENLIGRWPTVKQALARCETTEEVAR